MATVNPARAGSKARSAAAESKRVERARRWFRSQPGPRVGVWVELASLAKNLDLAAALAIIRDTHAELDPESRIARRPDDRVAVVAETWGLRVRNGQALADAIHGWATAREQMMIAVGESAGELAAVLKRMADAEKTLLALRRATVSSLRQPMIIIAWSWLMVPAYAWFLLWQLAQYPEIHNDITLLAADIARVLLYWLSWIVPLAIAGFTIWLIRLTRHWFSPIRPRYEGIWPLSLYKALAATDFLLALTVLKAAGWDESRALKAMRQTAPPYLAWQIAAIEPNSRSMPWSDALARANRAFPGLQENILMGMFARNPETFPAQLDELTADWIAKLQDRIERNRQAASAASMAVAAFLQILCGLLIMATALPV